MAVTEFPIFFRIDSLVVNRFVGLSEYTWEKSMITISDRDEDRDGISDLYPEDFVVDLNNETVVSLGIASAEEILSFLEQHKVFLGGIMGKENMNLLYSSVEVFADPIALQRAMNDELKQVPSDSLSAKEIFGD